MTRVLLEDRVFWELVLWGFVWGGEGTNAILKTLGLPWVIVKYLGYNYKKLAWSQGMGRHTKEDIEPWIHKDMKTLGVIFGNNKFLLGDEPCVEDCVAFGFAAQMFWGFPATSPYAIAAKEKYPNIEAYCNRMKERYFPDWDQLLKKPKSS
jgi:glutathione S-transferase